MDEMIRQQLESAGIDSTDLMERLMSNMTLISRFCKRFPTDTNYDKMIAGIQAGDAEVAFQSAHALKGVCGNLSMKGMLQVLEPVVEKLRVGSFDGVNELLPAIDVEYRKVVDAIESIQW